MNKWFACLPLLLLSLSTARADQFDQQLDECKGKPGETHCVAKVLLTATREYVKQGGGAPPSGGAVKCQCMCGGVTVTACTLYYVDGENSTVLGSNLSPQTCMDSLHYPPCRP